MFVFLQNSFVAILTPNVGGLALASGAFEKWSDDEGRPLTNGIIKEAHRGRTQGNVQSATWEEGPHQNLTMLAL